MAGYADLYEITYSYTGFQQSQGDNSFPGTQIDADLAGLEDSIAEIQAFIEACFRSDYVLKIGSLPGAADFQNSVDEAAASAVAADASADAAAVSAAAAVVTVNLLNNNYFNYLAQMSGLSLQAQTYSKRAKKSAAAAAQSAIDAAAAAIPDDQIAMKAQVFN